MRVLLIMLMLIGWHPVAVSDAPIPPPVLEGSLWGADSPACGSPAPAWVILSGC